MIDFFVDVFGGLSPEAITALLAFLPISELRGAIPVALTVFDLSLVSTLFFSFLGNVTPILLVWLLPPVRELAERRFPAWSKFFDRCFHRKQEHFRRNYKRFGAFALCLFVAVPLPFTGVWTGSVLAVLFHIPPQKSVPAILGGMVAAGILVAMIVQGTLGFLSWIL